MTERRARRGAWGLTGRATGARLGLPRGGPLKQSSAEPLSDMADDEAPQKENVMKEVRPPPLLRSCPATAAGPCSSQALTRRRPQIRIHKLVLNISVGESGDRLTKAAKVSAHCKAVRRDDKKQCCRGCAAGDATRVASVLAVTGAMRCDARGRQPRPPLVGAAHCCRGTALCQTLPTLKPAHGGGCARLCADWRVSPRRCWSS